jgi:SAM-dependent methyltransferase
MSSAERSKIFWEIHSGLPREGPGDDESTARAFRMASDLPAHPRILDVACGPGMQTLALARISDGRITALDTHRPFLAELRRRSAAAGYDARIGIVNASMRAMPFVDGAFDLIWSEGAIYIMGLRAGLTAWRRLLRARGTIVVTEPCWQAREIPELVRAHWAEYPAMTTIAGTRDVIRECGFVDVGHFALPKASWWTDYYTPKAARLAVLREKYRGEPAALAALDASERELAVHRRYGHLYDYVFFVMQRVA